MSSLQVEHDGVEGPASGSDADGETYPVELSFFTRLEQPDSIARLAVQWGIVAVFVLGWQLGTQVGLLDPFFFSRPSAVAARIWEWVSTGFIWPHLWRTIQAASIGLVVGSVAGLLSGLLLGRVGWLGRVLDPFMTLANSVPRVMLAPVFMLWFGLGLTSKVALVISLVYFIVFFNVYTATRNVEAILVSNVRLLGATNRQLMWHVVLPSALSWIFSSLRLSVSFAILGAVVGEYMGGTGGIGYLVAQYTGLFDTAGMFTALAFIIASVAIVDAAVAMLERYLLRWQRPNS